MVSLQVAVAAVALSAAGQTVLLDFSADWCGPCRAMDPTIQALVAKGYPVQKINIDQHPELKQKYGVSNIPCFVMLVDGREVDRVVGGTSFSRLEQMCRAGTDRPARAASPAPVTLASTVSTSTPSPTPSATRQQLATPGWTPRSRAASRTDRELIAASVRLRIGDATGHSCGSGTIVDARGGEALILTCGHIFRDSKGTGRIEVDLFGTGAPQRVAGRLISYDLGSDVGLVAVRVSGPVQTARVAPPNYKVVSGGSVVSVGCNNGRQPTARHSRVASINKYLGPPNLQVNDQPVEGRSGGGLFSEDGLLIGVCNAADPSDREGLYAALASIRAELDKAGLSCVYNPVAPSPGPAQPGSVAAPLAALVSVTPPTMSKQMPAPGATAVAQPLRADEQAALDEIHRRLQEGAEVICVIRPRNNPAARSEVIMLDRVSSAFLKQLAAEAGSQGSTHLTSFEIPAEGGRR